MKLIILVSLLAGTLAAPMLQSLSVNDDGTYQFYYETGKEAGFHKRSEIRQPDGVVIGKFSYEDPNGEIREVSYRADDSGYVANGDVSVEGAPKGQFPAAPEEAEDPPAEAPAPEDQPPPAEDSHQEDNEQPKEEHKTEDLKDLPLDEPSPDDPPEAFPQGYFLQHFQGLRRLPDVTPEEATGTELPSPPKDTEDSAEEPGKPEEPSSDILPSKTEDPHKLALKAAHDMFMHLRPFQSFSPQEVGTSMFHQPVYVYSYQHPDSYGYQYFF